MIRNRYEWIRECDARSRSDPEDEIVWIDIRRFNSIWLRDDPDRHFDPIEAAAQPKYVRFDKWIAAANEPVIMPHVGAANGWAFSNGRHRFCWFRDNGFASLPVTVWCQSAAELRDIAGFDECGQPGN